MYWISYLSNYPSSYWTTYLSFEPAIYQTSYLSIIIDSTWGRVSGLHAHSEAEAILEQRLLFVSLCEARMAFTRLWGIIVRIIPEASLTAPEDECLACMLTRKRRPYLSNDCSLFHCVRQGWPSQDLRNNSTNHSRGIIDSTRGRVPGLHAYSEAEAILEQRLLFVSLCEARMAFTRLWGIIVRIIPEASLTAPENECLACMLIQKRRPYLSNDCSLFHCVRQGWPSQDYEE